MTDIDNCYYSSSDIQEIINDGFDYELPQETLDVIENLSKKVGAPSYIKTPNFQKKFYNRNNNYKKHKNRNSMINDADWESIRNFKATEIKKKEGKDAYIDQIKRNLNKITDDSYVGIRDEILLIIEQVTNLDESEDILLSIGKTIFTIASQNKFYSNLYARLYSEVRDKIQVMGDIFQKSFDEFLKTFQVIEYVDSEEDYDKFCLVNRDNDNRKAMSLFIVYLTNYNMISTDSVVSLTKQLKAMFQENMEKPDCSKIVEEICENLCIIITKCEELNINFQDRSEWDLIIDYIQEVSKKDADDYPSLTNKIIFKCLDLIEEIN